MRKILLIIILSVIGMIYLNYTEQKELLNDMMDTLTAPYPTYDDEPTPVQTGKADTENGLNYPFQADNPNNLPILTETETAEDNTVLNGQDDEEAALVETRDENQPVENEEEKGEN